MTTAVYNQAMPVSKKNKNDRKIRMMNSVCDVPKDSSAFPAIAAPKNAVNEPANKRSNIFLVKNCSDLDLGIINFCEKK